MASLASSLSPRVELKALPQELHRLRAQCLSRCHCSTGPTSGKAVRPRPCAGSSPREDDVTTLGWRDRRGARRREKSVPSAAPFFHMKTNHAHTHTLSTWLHTHLAKLWSAFIHTSSWQTGGGRKGWVMEEEAGNHVFTFYLSA